MLHFPKNNSHTLPILLKLSDKSLTHLLATCKYFREFYKYDKLWNLKIVHQYGSEYLNNAGFEHYRQVKQFFSRAHKHVVPRHIYFNEKVSHSQSDFDAIVEPEPTKIALEYFKQLGIKLRRGDIIWFSFMDMQFTSEFTIFDGHILEPFDYTYDDVYGHIPRNFMF